MKKKENFWTVALVLAVLIGLVITTGGCPPGPDGGEGEGEGEGEIQIPNLTGQLQAGAQAAIVAAGLVVGDVTEICSDTMSAGRVISNSPVGGTSVNSGTNIDLLVSTGPCLIEIDTIEELQLIGNDSAYPLNSNYILTQDIDASATAGWNNGAGFNPIRCQFSGVFDGRNHIIINLTINRPDEGYVGLFRTVSADGKVMNVGLEGGAVMGFIYVGGLTGYNLGQLTDCYATGAVTGYFEASWGETSCDGYVGGLTGCNDGGVLTNCYATGAVTGHNYWVGGLIGYNWGGAATNCYATGAITGYFEAGGLTGYNSGQLTDCYATGAITGYSGVGGLIGQNDSGSAVTNCYATGAAVGEEWPVGGLAGYNVGQLTDCYATGMITGSYSVGGLVGYNWAGGIVTNCYASGAVVNGDDAGGLIGINSGQLTDCYATGAVTGYDDIGGLVGGNSGGVVTNCYATGAVVSEGSVGGLVGYNNSGGAVTNCYAIGAVTGDSKVGGLVGNNYGGVVTNCYATGAIVVEGGYYGDVGGLVGCNYDNNGTVMTSFWNMQTSGQTTSVGGTGLTTADMTQLATFAGAGWDFDSVWTIKEGCTYPYLQPLVSPFAGCVY